MGRELRDLRRPERLHHEAAASAAKSRPTALSPAFVHGLQRTAGNQAVQRLLSRPSGPMLQRWPYIVQASYMSGDMFGISAALALERESGVVILQETSPTELAKREPDQALFFRDFYRASLQAGRIRPADIDKRVKVVPVVDAQTVYKDLVSGGGRYAASVRRAAGLDPRDKFVAPGIATSIVGEAYENDKAPGARAKVREAWTSGRGPTPQQLAAFLSGKGILPNRKYALLWVRLSAKTKKGGAHPELDTSQQGVRDLTAAIRRQTDREVVLVGDNPGKPNLLVNAIDMLEFWNQAPFTTGEKVEKRMAQLRLFSFMVNNRYDVVSIGMRSGAMEGPALLGVPTVYIEEEGNEQAERMEKWRGKVPNWTQAKVKTLPTRTGRRYKTRDAAVSLPWRERRVDDAVGAVMRRSGGGFRGIKDRLLASYSDDLEAFQLAFIAASRRSWDRQPPFPEYVRDLASTTEGRDFETALREELETWHEEYVAWREAADECTTQEQEIARAAGASASGMRLRLAALPTALDPNAGLADFVRDAQVAFALDPATPPTPPLRDGLRKWRSAYSGKWLLDKGFTPADVALVMDTPTLKRDRYERIVREHEALLRDIDTLFSENPGTTVATLRAFMQRSGRPGLQAFIEAFVAEVSRGLRRLLHLEDSVPPAEVVTRFTSHIETTDGAAWWATAKPKLVQLHAVAWAA